MALRAKGNPPVLQPGENGIHGFRVRCLVCVHLFAGKVESVVRVCWVADLVEAGLQGINARLAEGDGEVDGVGWCCGAIEGPSLRKLVDLLLGDAASGCQGDYLANE